MESAIYNASGCWCTTAEELEDLLESQSGALISKSGTVKSRQGNEEPRLKYDLIGSINSMGVPNLGHEFYTKIGNEVSVFDKPYIQSIIPFNMEEMLHMLSHIESEAKGSRRRLVEVNLSCPNIVGKTILAYDMEALEQYLAYIDLMEFDNLTIGLKLPPYYEPFQFDAVSELIKKYNKNIKFITCINSIVSGLLVDPVTNKTKIRPKSGFGGVGGIYCKPTALANVKQFYDRLNGVVDIVGCGGVVTGMDVYEHILCGATAVQVGTQLMKEGPECFERLNEELKKFMKVRGYTKLEEFRGKLELA